MSIRPFVMPFRLSCAYLIYDADAALPHLNPRKRRRGGIFIYEKRDHCIISCNSLFIFLINANLLTLPTWAPLQGFCIRRCSIWHHMQGGGAYVAKDRRSSMTRSYPRRICQAGKEKNAGIAGLCRGFSTQSARQRQAEMAARIELLRSAKKHPIRRSVHSCVFS